MRYLCCVSAAIASLLTSCAGGGVQGTFKNQPVVWSVDDERPIPEPKERRYISRPNLIDVLGFVKVLRAVDPPRQRPAQNTNALDDLPDSSWYHNRISRRRITPAELTRGPGTNGPPELPLVIVSAKKGGANPGFVAKDARGVRFLVKFDTAENPEQQTGNNAAVNRIFWALGFNVPSDHVFHFRRSQVTLSPKVQRKGVTEADVDAMVLAATRSADGTIRASASEFLQGIPKGGWSPTGRRFDDANDRVAHEDRRELRGLRIFSAWLGHTDVKEDNTLDMYDPKRRVLRHYLVDFGEAFGGHQSEKNRREVGFEYHFDWKNQAKALLSFGMWVRTWERQKRTPWKSVGYFGSAQFDPKTWHEAYPYWPFHHVDRADAYWAAKLVMRFDRALLRAAIDAGKFSQPAAATYLVNTLLARRDKVGRAYLEAVTPLDEWRVEKHSVCAVDLSRKYGLVSSGTVEARAPHGAWRRVAATDPNGRVCVPLQSGPGAHIIELRIRRAARTTPHMQLHYYGGAVATIVGVIRTP